MTYTVQLDHRTLESTRPLEGGPRVAIVGSRRAAQATVAYAQTLAASVAEAGGIVISGGAVGVDTAAHKGALAIGGKTWVVAPTGKQHVYPRENKGLFLEIARSDGAMIWPFEPSKKATRPGFHDRNEVIVALADAIVVVQAATEHSGTFSTANKALNANKPLWVVPLPPWLNGVAGTVVLLRRLDVHVLWRTRDLLASVGLATPPVPNREDPDERAVLVALKVPLFRDEVLARTGLTVPKLARILFGLQLEGLVRDRLDGRIERVV